MIERLLQEINKNADKVLHASGGYFTATILPFSEALTFVIVTLLGVTKEVYDYYHKDAHTVDVADILATCLGGLTGCLVRLMFYS